MKLSAALEYENIRRNPADWNKIYLNHDGKFFHAYEWSAWLIKAVVCTEEYQQQRGDAKMLTAIFATCSSRITPPKVRTVDAVRGSMPG